MSTYPYITSKHSATIITLSEGRKWLRMDVTGFTEEDNNITDAINSAISRVERVTNIELGVSEFEWITFCLPCKIRDTRFVQEIKEIAYFSSEGWQEINPSSYTLIQSGMGNHIIQWKPNISVEGNVRIRFAAGIPSGKVPAQLKQAIRALMSEYFDEPTDRVSEKRTLSDKILENYTIGYAG